MRVDRLPLSIVLSAVLLLTVLTAPAALADDNPYPCDAEQSWVTHPDPPEEIPGGGEDFCDFYQFAWQWFLTLGSPDRLVISEGGRIFQNNLLFPEWEESPKSSCDSTPESGKPSLFIRDVKTDDLADAQDPQIPDRTGQAGGGAVIRDRTNQPVYYNVQFSRELCYAQTSGDLPPGTTEIKTSWRVLGEEAGEGAPGYLTWNVVIDGVNGNRPVDLGLVGFHLFLTTSDHPEGVWMTWEHVANDPDCTDPQAEPAGGWSFTSSACAECLNGIGEYCDSCHWNDPAAAPTDPTQICRVHPYGTAPGDNHADENLAVVQELNEQLVGPDGYITQLPASDPMAVWKNYFMVGGLWVSDPTKAASSANQRGSLQLANTSMETTFQGDTSNGMVNCFGCHDYVPKQTATSHLSHIFSTIHGGGGAQAARPGGHELRFLRTLPAAPEPAAGREE